MLPGKNVEISYFKHENGLTDEAHIISGVPHKSQDSREGKKSSTEKIKIFNLNFF